MYASPIIRNQGKPAHECRPPDRLAAARHRDRDVRGEPAARRCRGASRHGRPALYRRHYDQRGHRRVRQSQHRPHRGDVRDRRITGPYRRGAAHRRLAGDPRRRSALAPVEHPDADHRPPRLGHEFDRGRRDVHPGRDAHRQPEPRRPAPAHDADGLCRADQRHDDAGRHFAQSGDQLRVDRQRGGRLQFLRLHAVRRPHPAGEHPLHAFRAALAATRKRRTTPWLRAGRK